MNTQNILKFYGSKLDISLDSSEYYDYELSKVDNDYVSEVLDLSKPITYSSLKVSDSLENFSSFRDTITLTEYDNRVNDSNYIYSGLTVILNYNEFVNYFNTSGYTYEQIILNNNVYIYEGISNEIHYFTITAFNEENVYPNNDFSYFRLIDNFIDCIQDLDNQDNCCVQPLKLSNKPWAYEFDSGIGENFCENIIERRNEDGWTIDFVFNRENLNWSDGEIFYYIGVRGDDNIRNYADNNLSFGFTDDGRIKWSTIHYSGFCQTNSGYTEVFYIASGETPQLCVTGSTGDFNITITFKRNKKLTDCNIENDGGWNDLITGKTLNNSPLDIISGATPNYSYYETLNKKWTEERNDRLGVLKIYLNGRPIYKLKDWEEVVYSKRGLQPFIQSWGGGTGLMYNIHNGICKFNIKSIKYYDEPLDFVHVRHNYLVTIKPNYNIIECGDICEDDVIGLNL